MKFKTVFCLIGIIYGFFLRYQVYIPISVADEIHAKYADDFLGVGILSLLSYPLTLILSIVHHTYQKLCLQTYNKHPSHHIAFTAI
jgi:hypothetical protein